MISVEDDLVSNVQGPVYRDRRIVYLALFDCKMQFSLFTQSSSELIIVAIVTDVKRCSELEKARNGTEFLALYDT